MLQKIESMRQAHGYAGGGMEHGGHGAGGMGQDAMDMKALADAVLSMHAHVSMQPHSEH